MIMRFKDIKIGEHFVHPGPCVHAYIKVNKRFAIRTRHTDMLPGSIFKPMGDFASVIISPINLSLDNICNDIRKDI